MNNGISGGYDIYGKKNFGWLLSENRLSKKLLMESWNIIKLKDTFDRFFSIRVGNGKSTPFWNYSYMGGNSSFSPKIYKGSYKFWEE